MNRNDLLGMIEENRGWFIALGLLLTVLGVSAVLLPHIMTLTTELFVGSLMFVAGIAQIVHAFGKKKWGAILLELAVGSLYTAGGMLLFLDPVRGALALTIILSAVFIAEGVMRTILSFRLRPADGWGWMLASGVVSSAAGVLIAAGLPSTAVWAIGLLVGMNFLMSGLTFLYLAAIRRRDSDAMTPAVQG